MASAEVWPLDVGGGKGWLKALKAGTLNLRGEKVAWRPAHLMLISVVKNVAWRPAHWVARLQLGA